MTGNLAQDLEVEDLGGMIISAGDRAFGEILASHSIPVGTNELVWYGSGGTAVVEYWQHLRYRTPDSDWAAVSFPDAPDRFRLEIAHFVSAVLDDRQPAVSVDDGLAVSRVITCAYESAASRETVTVQATVM